MQILRDMQGPAPMMRLLQGDVGSGKTAVAMLALLAAAGSGWQGALMAPTEVRPPTQSLRILNTRLLLLHFGLFPCTFSLSLFSGVPPPHTTHTMPLPA